MDFAESDRRDRRHRHVERVPRAPPFDDHVAGGAACQDSGEQQGDREAGARAGSQRLPCAIPQFR